MLAQTARKALVATLVAGAVVVLALALWKLRLVISLVFLGFIIAAAMRPGIEALQRRRIPRGAGLAIHYLVLAGLVALFLWLVVPRAVTQVQNALGPDHLKHAARTSTGIKHEILVGLEKRLRRPVNRGVPCRSNRYGPSPVVTATCHSLSPGRYPSTSIPGSILTPRLYRKSDWMIRLWTS